MKGVVVNGLVRDVHTLRKENYAIWCTGTTPLGCINENIKAPVHIEAEAMKRKAYFEDSIMVCDDSGCTLIAKEHINENTLKKLEFMELQEDVWFYCLDTLKWSTYETVCLQKYLENKNHLPPVLVNKLKEYKL